MPGAFFHTLLRDAPAIVLRDRAGDGGCRGTCDQFGGSDIGEGAQAQGCVGHPGVDQGWDRYRDGAHTGTVGGGDPVGRVFEDQAVCRVGGHVGGDGEKNLGRRFDCTDVIGCHDGGEMLKNAVFVEPTMDPFAIAARTNGQCDAVCNGVVEQCMHAGPDGLCAAVLEESLVIVGLPMGPIDGSPHAGFECVVRIESAGGTEACAPFAELEDLVVGLPHFVDDDEIL